MHKLNYDSIEEMHNRYKTGGKLCILKEKHMISC